MDKGHDPTLPLSPNIPLMSHRSSPSSSPVTSQISPATSAGSRKSKIPTRALLRAASLPASSYPTSSSSHVWPTKRLQFLVTIGPRMMRLFQEPWVTHLDQYLVLGTPQLCGSTPTLPPHLLCIVHDLLDPPHPRSPRQKRARFIKHSAIGSAPLPRPSVDWLPESTAEHRCDAAGFDCD